MIHHTRILIWENRRRVEVLHQFCKLLDEYFAALRHDHISGEPIETEKSQNLRVQIARLLDDARGIIGAAGLSPIIHWTAPPVAGGYSRYVDVVESVFNLHTFRISAEDVFDFSNRAIGIYERGEKAAKMRVFNPLFYLGVAVEWVASLPFVLVGRAGFNRQRIESSKIGKLLKLIFEAIALGAGIVTILQPFHRWPW